MQELIVITKTDLQTLLQALIRTELEQFRQGTTTVTRNEPEFLNIRQASDLLNLKVQTIYGYVHKRKLPYIKSRGGKNLLFEKSKLLTWLQDGERTVQSHPTH